MTDLSRKEREFLEAGGALWCLKEFDDGWKVVKVTWEEEADFRTLYQSREVAARMAFLLADLAVPGEPVAIHHAVPRPPGCAPDYFPRML